MDSRIDYIVYGVKLFYFCLCTIFIFSKITNVKLNDKKEIGLIVSIMGIIILLCTICVFRAVYVNILLYSSICFCLYTILKKNIGYIMLANIISFAIYYILYAIAVSVTFFIGKILGTTNKIILMLIIFFIIQVLLNLFFRIKRIKNGFQFLKSEKTNHYINTMLLVVSCIVSYLYSIITYNFEVVPDNDMEFTGESTTKYMFFSIVFFSIIMIIMIRETLILAYKQGLLEKTISDYEQSIKEKDEKIQKLSDEKYKISKLNHEFHNRQEALILKVENALSNMNYEAGEEIDLKEKIKALSDEYTGKVKENKLESNLPKTYIEEIDDMFTYMQSECKKNNIEFILQINGNINYLINHHIDKTKLVTLIGDHLRDAIIAINYSNNNYKSILAVLGIKDENYEFCIYDSGIEFEIDTLEKLGIEPATTHKDSGGTGIGFITTFETLKETKASFVLEELNELKENNYTKVVRFIFDNKNELKLISYRANLLKEKLKAERFKIISEEINSK